MKLFIIIWVALLVIKVTISDSNRLQSYQIKGWHFWVYASFQIGGGLTILNFIL